MGDEERKISTRVKVIVKNPPCSKPLEVVYERDGVTVSTLCMMPQEHEGECKPYVIAMMW